MLPFGRFYKADCLPPCVSIAEAPTATIRIPTSKTKLLAIETHRRHAVQTPKRLRILPTAGGAGSGETILLNYDFSKTCKPGFRRITCGAGRFSKSKLPMLREVGSLNKGWPVWIVHGIQLCFESISSSRHTVGESV